MKNPKTATPKKATVKKVVVPVNKIELLINNAHLRVIKFNNKFAIEFSTAQTYKKTRLRKQVFYLLSTNKKDIEKFTKEFTQKEAIALKDSIERDKLITAVSKLDSLKIGNNDLKKFMLLYLASHTNRIELQSSKRVKSKAISA